MRILKTSLIIALPALLAGYAAWFFIPCQPQRSIPVPVGTKLLEFSPAGKYVLTLQSAKHELTIRNAEGRPIYATEIPCELFISVNHVRAFYAFSADDRWLAVAIDQPDHPQLVIVDLESNNALIPVADLPAEPDFYRPRPTFSSDCHFLSYFIRDDPGQCFPVLYDISAKREHLRIVGSYQSSLGPNLQGDWFLAKEAAIECWDINQKRRQAVLPLAALGPCGHGKGIREVSLAPDEQALIALCEVESPSTEQGFSLYRYDLNTRATKCSWEYRLPAAARFFWHSDLSDPCKSDPCQFLLIRTLNGQGDLVQDLVDVKSGEIVARYSKPIDPMENAWPLDAGFAEPLGRTGEIVIDSQQQVLVSKDTTWPEAWWEPFGAPAWWLGLKIPPPALNLRFHSARTGELLDQVFIHKPPINEFNPVNEINPSLITHPSKPLLAVIDGDETESHIQFWRVPPPKPWGRILGRGLAAGAVVFLLRLGLSKRRASFRAFAALRENILKRIPKAL